MASKFARIFKSSQFLQSKIAIFGIAFLLIAWFVGAFALDQRAVFLPGETSEGHFLLEVSCQSCHDGFQPVSNDTCMRCHEAELAEDVHPPQKFLDPRWANLKERLDVTTCTTCHAEHVHMFGRGVHLQPDLCMACHEGIIQGDLASHDDFSRDGCWTAGCHNFHDHRSISRGFLRGNLDQPAMLPEPKLPKRDITVTQETPPDPDLGTEFLGGEG